MNKKDIESIVFLVSATIMMMQCKITTRNSRHGIEGRYAAMFDLLHELEIYEKEET